MSMATSALSGKVVVVVGDLEQRLVGLHEHPSDLLSGGLPDVVNERLSGRNLRTVVPRLEVEVLRRVVHELVPIRGGYQYAHRPVLRGLDTAVPLQPDVLERLRPQLAYKRLYRRDALSVGRDGLRSRFSNPILVLRALPLAHERLRLTGVECALPRAHPTGHPIQRRLAHLVLDVQFVLDGPDLEPVCDSVLGDGERSR